MFRIHSDKNSKDIFLTFTVKNQIISPKSKKCKYISFSLKKNFFKKWLENKKEKEKHIKK